MTVCFLKLVDVFEHGFDTLIDVRSPAEFAEDHLPGAVNLPVLSNSERVRVGTIYKQDSAFTAKKVGAALVARNSAKHLDGQLAGKDGSWQPLIYCWRGGQRSGSFATILKQIGWRAKVVQGGYQSYRRLISDYLYGDPLPHDIIVLDGNTGTAKTELLHILAQNGEQIVDLEGLAAHRGSIFGAVAQPQPSQKAFEGALAGILAGVDPTRRVWIEAESSKIGNLIIPPALWQAMKSAPRISVSAPIKARADYLVSAYGDILYDRAALQDRLTRLIVHQGHERVEQWQLMACNGENLHLAAELIQHHYDPSYARSRSLHASQKMGEISASDLSTEALLDMAKQLVELAQRATVS